MIKKWGILVDKYKVFFYFGVWKPNPFVTPKIVEVEVPKGEHYSENDIVILALKKYGKPYPKTYSANIIKVS